MSEGKSDQGNESVAQPEFGGGGIGVYGTEVPEPLVGGSGGA